MVKRTESTTSISILGPSHRLASMRLAYVLAYVHGICILSETAGSTPANSKSNFLSLVAFLERILPFHIFSFPPFLGDRAKQSS